jgi:hypothetical protein
MFKEMLEEIARQEDLKGLDIMMSDDNEILDWLPQAGNMVDTGITGTGTVIDYWKHMKNELILHEIVVPVKIQMLIDSFIDGTNVVQSSEPNEITSDSMTIFTDTLNTLSKKTGLYVVGPQGVMVTSLKEARDYDAGHRPKRGEYSILDSINKNPTEWVLNLK